VSGWGLERQNRVQYFIVNKVLRERPDFGYSERIGSGMQLPIGWVTLSGTAKRGERRPQNKVGPPISAGAARP